MQQRTMAFRAANYSLNKNTTLKAGETVLGEQIREKSLTSQAWLREALSVPFDGTTVAVALRPQFAERRSALRTDGWHRRL